MADGISGTRPTPQRLFEIVDADKGLVKITIDGKDRQFRVRIGGQQIQGHGALEKTHEQLEKFLVGDAFQQVLSDFVKEAEALKLRGSMKVIINENGARIEHSGIAIKKDALGKEPQKPAENESEEVKEKYELDIEKYTKESEKLTALEKKCETVFNNIFKLEVTTKTGTITEQTEIKKAFDSKMQKVQEFAARPALIHKKLDAVLKEFTKEEVQYALDDLFNEVLIGQLVSETDMKHPTLASILNEPGNEVLHEVLQRYTPTTATTKKSFFTRFRSKSQQQKAVDTLRRFVSNNIAKNPRTVEVQGYRVEQRFTKGTQTSKKYFGKGSEKPKLLINPRNPGQIGEKDHAYPSSLDKKKFTKEGPEIEDHSTNLGSIVATGKDGTSVPVLRSGRMDNLPRLQEGMLFALTEQLKADNAKGLQEITKIDENGKPVIDGNGNPVLELDGKGNPVLEFEHHITTHLDFSKLKGLGLAFEGKEDDAAFLRNILSACDEWPPEGYKVSLQDREGEERTVILKKPRITNQIMGSTIRGIQIPGKRIELGQQAQDRVNFISNTQMLQDWLATGVVDRESEKFKKLVDAAKTLAAKLPTVGELPAVVAVKDGIIDFSQVSLLKMVDDTKLASSEEYKSYQRAVADLLLAHPEDTTAKCLYCITFRRDLPPSKEARESLKAEIEDGKFSIAPEAGKELHAADLEIYRNTLDDTFNISKGKQCASGADRTIIGVGLAVAQSCFEERYGFRFDPAVDMDIPEHRLHFKQYFREAVKEFGIAIAAETKGYPGIKWAAGISGNPVAYKYLFNEQDIRDIKRLKINDITVDKPDVLGVTYADYRKKGQEQYKGKLRDSLAFYGKSKESNIQKLEKKKQELLQNKEAVDAAQAEVVEFFEKLGVSGIHVSNELTLRSHVKDLNLNEGIQKKDEKGLLLVDEDNKPIMHTRLEALEDEIKQNLENSQDKEGSEIEQMNSQKKEGSRLVAYSLSMVRDMWLQREDGKKRRVESRKGLVEGEPLPALGGMRARKENQSTEEKLRWALQDSLSGINEFDIRNFCNLLTADQRMRMYSEIKLKGDSANKEEKITLLVIESIAVASADKELITLLKSPSGDTLRRELVLYNPAMIETKKLFGMISSEWDKAAHGSEEYENLKRFCSDWTAQNRETTLLNDAIPVLKKVLGEDFEILIRPPEQREEPVGKGESFKAVIDDLVATRFASEKEYQKKVKLVAQDIGNGFIKGYAELEQSDLVKSKFGPNKKDTALEKLTQLTNDSAAYISNVIVSAEEKDDRGRIIKFFINVAKELEKENNYAAAFTIYRGISHSSVIKLKKTWERIEDSKEYNIFREEREKLYSPDKNFLAMRQRQQELLDKGIPHLFPLEIVSNDLFFGGEAKKAEFVARGHREIYNDNTLAVMDRVNMKYLSSQEHFKDRNTIQETDFFALAATDRRTEKERELEVQLDKAIENAAPRGLKAKVEARFKKEKTVEETVHFLKELKELFNISNTNRWVQYSHLQKKYNSLVSASNSADPQNKKVLDDPQKEEVLKLLEVADTALKGLVSSDVDRESRTIQKDRFFGLTRQINEDKKTIISGIRGVNGKTKVGSDLATTLMGKEKLVSIASILASDIVNTLYSSDVTAQENATLLLSFLLEHENLFTKVLEEMPGLGELVRSFIEGNPIEGPQKHLAQMFTFIDKALDPREQKPLKIIENLKKLKGVEQDVLNRIKDPTEKTRLMDSFETKHAKIEKRLKIVIENDQQYTLAKKEMAGALKQIKNIMTQKDPVNKSELYKWITQYQQQESTLKALCGGSVALENEYIFSHESTALLEQAFLKLGSGNVQLSYKEPLQGISGETKVELPVEDFTPLGTAGNFVYRVRSLPFKGISAGEKRLEYFKLRNELQIIRGIVQEETGKKYLEEAERVLNGLAETEKVSELSEKEAQFKSELLENLNNLERDSKSAEFLEKNQKLYADPQVTTTIANIISAEVIKSMVPGRGLEAEERAAQLLFALFDKPGIYEQVCGNNPGFEDVVYALVIKSMAPGRVPEAEERASQLLFALFDKPEAYRQICNHNRGFEDAINTFVGKQLGAEKTLEAMQGFAKAAEKTTDIQEALGGFDSLVSTKEDAIGELIGEKSYKASCQQRYIQITFNKELQRVKEHLSVLLEGNGEYTQGKKDLKRLAGTIKDDSNVEQLSKIVDDFREAENKMLEIFGERPSLSNPKALGLTEEYEKVRVAEKKIAEAKRHALTKLEPEAKIQMVSDFEKEMLELSAKLEKDKNRAAILYFNAKKKFKELELVVKGLDHPQIDEHFKSIRESFATIEADENFLKLSDRDQDLLKPPLSKVLGNIPAKNLVSKVLGSIQAKDPFEYFAKDPTDKTRQNYNDALVKNPDVPHRMARLLSHEIGRVLYKEGDRTKARERVDTVLKSWFTNTEKYQETLKSMPGLKDMIVEFVVHDPVIGKDIKKMREYEAMGEGADDVFEIEDAINKAKESGNQAKRRLGMNNAFITNIFEEELNRITTFLSERIVAKLQDNKQYQEERAKLKECSETINKYPAVTSPEEFGELVKLCEEYRGIEAELQEMTPQLQEVKKALKTPADWEKASANGTDKLKASSQMSEVQDQVNNKFKEEIERLKPLETVDDLWKKLQSPELLKRISKPTEEVGFLKNSVLENGAVLQGAKELTKELGLLKALISTKETAKGKDRKEDVGAQIKEKVLSIQEKYGGCDGICNLLVDQMYASYIFSSGPTLRKPHELVGYSDIRNLLANKEVMAEIGVSNHQELVEKFHLKEFEDINIKYGQRQHNMDDAALLIEQRKELGGELVFTCLMQASGFENTKFGNAITLFAEQLSSLIGDASKKLAKPRQGMEQWEIQDLKRSYVQKFGDCESINYTVMESLFSSKSELLKVLSEVCKEAVEQKDDALKFRLAPAIRAIFLPIAEVLRKTPNSKGSLRVALVEFIKLGTELVESTA